MSEQPLRLDRGELRRLSAAMREGYEGAIGEVETEAERGFVLGWKAAFEAIDKVADLMPDLAVRSPGAGD